MAKIDWAALGRYFLNGGQPLDPNAMAQFQAGGGLPGTAPMQPGGPGRLGMPVAPTPPGVGDAPPPAMPPEASGLQSYQQPAEAPMQPGGPSRVGISAYAPVAFGGRPPVPVARPSPSAGSRGRRAPSGGGLEALLTDQASRFLPPSQTGPTATTSPAAVGSFSGFDPTAAYAGAPMARGGGTGAGMAAATGGPVPQPDEWTGHAGGSRSAQPGLMDWIAKRMGWA